MANLSNELERNILLRRIKEEKMLELDTLTLEQKSYIERLEDMKKNKPLKNIPFLAGTLCNSTPSDFLFRVIVDKLKEKIKDDKDDAENLIKING